MLSSLLSMSNQVHHQFSMSSLFRRTTTSMRLSQLRLILVMLMILMRALLMQESIENRLLLLPVIDLPRKRMLSQKL